MYMYIYIYVCVCVSVSVRRTLCGDDAVITYYRYDIGIQILLAEMHV